jgi:hypothetical protein
MLLIHKPIARVYQTKSKVNQFLYYLHNLLLNFFKIMEILFSKSEELGYIFATSREIENY